MLDLNDLRLFVRIVEHKGIVKASRALQLPKSTLSRRLASLEDHLNTRLVIRSGEEFRLTANGEEVYQAACEIVEAAQRAEDLLVRSSEDIGGRVSINASPLFGAALPPHLAAMIASHPGLSIMLDMAERDLDAAGDRFDLYLRAHHWDLRDSTLIQRRICRNPLLAVAAPDLAGTADGRFPKALLETTALFVFDADGQAGGWMFHDADGHSHKVSASPRLVTTDAGLLREMALTGAGVALVPEFCVRDAVREGSLSPVAPGWIGPEVTMSLLSPPRRLMNRTLRRTADELAAFIKNAVLYGNQWVPDTEPGVPEGDRLHFIQVSHGLPSQVSRAPEAGMENAPNSNLAESEIAMTPFMRAFGVAALTAAVSLPLPTIAQDAPGPLVLYTNDFEGVITDRFEADTGRQIDVVQMSGGEILARIAAEASNPQWDVLIYNGSYTLHGLDQQGQLLQNVEPANLSNLNEMGRSYLPEDKSWFPIGLSASCVMLYRTDLIDNPPKSFADLADPRFNGAFGMADPAVAAPAYPCVAEFYKSLGQEAAEKLFTSYFDNGMRVFRTNGPVGQALASGDLSLALITSQVAYSLKAAGETPVEVVWPEDGAPGVVRGVGIQNKTARPEAAKAFVEWLLKPETQSYLAGAMPADGVFEPTVTGAVRRPDGPPETVKYRVAPDDFSVENEAAIKTWFADRAVQ